MVPERRKFLTVASTILGFSVANRVSLANVDGGSKISAGLDSPDIVTPEQFVVMVSVVQRLHRLQNYVGFGYFNLIGWREAQKFARNYPAIGPFSKDEITFIEQIFHSDASLAGYHGGRVTSLLSSAIERNDVHKVPGSGHYLFRGTALETYRSMRRDVSENIILTSGVRNVIKQFYLYLSKAVSVGGYLSMVSRSLAPPGYSYHATGDFDIGVAGSGRRNFTLALTRTEEYQKLIELDYVEIRYPRNNPFGVRYEPWHIKVTRNPGGPLT